METISIIIISIPLWCIVWVLINLAQEIRKLKDTQMTKIGKAKDFSERIREANRNRL